MMVHSHSFLLLLFLFSLCGFALLFAFCASLFHLLYAGFPELQGLSPRNVTLSLFENGKLAFKELGEMLQHKGLIRDSKIFILQEMLSEYRGKEAPGIYDLSTAMTAEEMLAVMCMEPVVEEEEEALVVIPEEEEEELFIDEDEMESREDNVIEEEVATEPAQ